MFTPDYDSATGLLTHLNSEELKQLLNDEDKLENMMNDLEQVKLVNAEKELIIASNKSLAEYNLSLKPELEQSRMDLISQYETASELKTNVQKLRGHLGGKKCQTDADTVLALLQAAAAQAEETSELIFENLIAGKITVDAFLQEFLQERTHTHVLRTKSDKMAALLLQGNITSPPQRPRRMKKAPPPPPAVKKPASPSLNTYSGRVAPILPTRIAPQPPVHIPRRHSPQVATPLASQSRVDHSSNVLPCAANVSTRYPYPPVVYLSN